MHKSENEKIDFILDEHERISRKQGSLNRPGNPGD